MAEKIKLYQPSNATDGDIFMSRFCYRCSKMPHDRDAKNQCFIVLSTMAWSVDDPEYPKQWRYIDDKPVCTAFVDREEANTKRRERLKPNSDKQTLNLF